ncbi:glutaminyl-peptide cyclotransferase [candidate division KSB3 bacterium]|uniref:Glutaminyl-peptide cyclotransferase n=1 Tax=candidate division KSB3 bacterium TaxID=2044937 RepID=A0A9D5JY09_9BACT|nr:glutaminyl-peptide cyclotransferase [candidate division KSB3 bacterium]MBD3326394.1 glutaminyl-peptide cyclotransferase [candidate division KSB3 bacterium]
MKMKPSHKQKAKDRRQPNTSSVLLGVLLTASGVLNWGHAAESAPVKVFTVQIINMLPHATTSFTQGLLYYDGFLYESTGLHGRSSLQKIDAETGEVLQFLAVPEVFAEGLARWQNRLVQLTWKSRTAYIYNLMDFSEDGRFHYQSEGWGLTATEQQLIMSDGTDRLVFRNPKSFAIERSIQVTFQGKPLHHLNELEYIEGIIYANVWYQNYIVQIEPEHGRVIGVIDARPLLHLLPPLSSDSVLNGIAYNHDTQTLYLTGKNWPRIFEVRLAAKEIYETDG